MVGVLVSIGRRGTRAMGGEGYAVNGKEQDQQKMRSGARRRGNEGKGRGNQQNRKESQIVGGRREREN